MTNQQRLFRSRESKIIAGICGGLGEYLNIDVTIVRLVWVLLTFMGGSGIIIYIIAYFIIPLRPIGTGEASPPVQTDFTVVKIFGVIFIITGVLILLDNLDILTFHRWWHMSWEYVFPSLLILIGAYFIMKKEKLNQETTLKNEQGGEPPQADIGQNPPLEPKVLRRSVMDKKLFGICGGIAEYFQMDPSIIRVGYVIFTVLSGGTGILIYLLMLLIIPEGKFLSFERK